MPVIVWIIAGPITVWAPSHDHPGRIGAMLELVPHGASISATTTFTPLLANRDEVYVFPNPWVQENYGAPGVAIPDPETVAWVAIRTDVEQEFASLVTDLVASGTYTIVHEDGPFVLLRHVAQDG